MANKKITQLASKSSVLSTDLFPIGDASTGTLYKKTIAELQAAIGGAVISVNGKVGTVVLNTDDVSEATSPTNLYFTNTRARVAISLTTTGSSGASTYSSSTGVLNVPTYTLAGLGGITATFLSGGTGITYNSGTGVISYSGTVYTDSSVRGLFSGGTGITYNSSTGAISYSGTVYTDSSIRALFSGTSPITYNSTTGAIGITGDNLTESTSSVLTITGGTGALVSAASIQVKQASGSQSGFLSSTDWTTFNNKQNALTNPVTGTGTTNFLPKWTSTSAIGDSVIQENSGSIGINGAAVPDAGDTRIQINATTFASLNLKSTNVNANIRSHNTNGGFYLGTITNHFVSFFSNDTERMRITSGGNVGIGITNPVYKLTVISTPGASSFDGITLTTGSADIISLYRTGSSYSYGMIGANQSWMYSNFGDLNIMTDASSASIKFGTSGGAERMRITSGGEVCINTTSTINSDRLMVQMANNTNQTGLGVRAINDGGTASQPAISFYNGSGVLLSRMYADNGTGYFAINTTSSNTERLRIVNSSGNILLGTSTDNGERLYVSGSIRATGTITANSDITLKKNLAKIENALEKVEQINGYTYEFKADDSKRHAGVIAQEIEGVLPEIVNKGNDGLLGVEYGNISALLIEAIKEQQKKIQELEVKLIALGQ